MLQKSCYKLIKNFVQVSTTVPTALYQGSAVRYFQIGQSGAIPVLVTMLEKAKGDIERLNACNTLWTLAFYEENKKEINSNESAILELQKLLLSTNSELKRAAAGTLWECEGKQKHTEETQMSAAVQEATGRRGSRFLPPTSFTRCLFFPSSVGWGDEGPWD